jgi:hypothetical protein
MKKLLALSILASSQAAFAAPVTLSLPDNATLTFEAPAMNDGQEERDGNMFQYMATSMGKADPRFNLSIYVEPKACAIGKLLKDVTQCFVVMNSRNPAIVADSTKTRCTEKSCEVSYRTLHKVGAREVELAHTNTIMVYGDLWVDVHFSITMPTPEDAGVAGKFSDSLALAVKAT